MAATLPSDAHLQETTSKKTTRRQWSIQGGPKGLLRRMRSQLAEDGCPESQLVMGKTLLEQLDQEHEGDREGARLAVFWLTRASLQGNSEATKLLQDCLDNNIGICEHNYHEVRECLAMDLQEKLARRAAHMLFCSVSDGNDVISSSGLASKVAEVLAGGEKDDMETVVPQQNHMQPESRTSLEELYGGERFTEDHVVSGSVLYCQGHVPPLHHFLTLGSRTPYTSPLLQAIDWPRRTLEAIFHSCIYFLGVVLTNYVVKILGILTPFIGGLIICLIGSFMSLFGVENLIVFLPVIASCISLIMMTVSSVHMLLNRKHFDSFHIWSLVFSHYCPELDVDQAESRFKARYWKPYATLCVAMFFYLSTVPLTSPTLMIIFLPVMCFTAITTVFLVPEKLTGWQFVSLTIYILAITPSVHSSISSWLFSVSEGTGLEHIFVENHVDVIWKVKLHLGVGSLLHLLWFILQLGMLVHSGPSYLPPHLVSILWCHLAIVASQKVATPIELLYPFAGWSILVLLPTIASIMLLVGPALICVSLSIHVGTDYQILMLIFCSCIFFMWILKHWWPKLILVCKWVVMGGILLTFLHPSLFVRSSPTQYNSLQWESYKNVCLPSKESGAVTTHGCLPLKGTLVKWQGSVAQVNVLSVRNLPEIAFSLFPTVIVQAVRCYLGKKLPPCPVSKVTTTQIERCQLLHNVLGSDTCTLENWNEYNFDITVAMSSSYWKFGNEGSQVSLYADSTFQEFMLKLHLGDQVEFVGALTEGIGSNQPRLHLSSIKCINCKSKLGSVHKVSPQLNSNIWVVPSYIFNFFLGPTLTI